MNDLRHNAPVEGLDDPIGGAWLVQHHGLGLVMPLAVASQIAGRRATVAGHPTTVERHVEAMRPQASLRGHLTFHLKHEVPHFELLSRVFHACDADEIAHWVASEPTGQYARRAAFLYEFFTGRSLPVPPGLGGGYHDAISANDVVVATPGRGTLNRRWRIRDNLPGSRDFCPMVVKAHAGLQAFTLDLGAMVRELEAEFGAEMLMRSAVWMTLRESRASFAIEGEADETDRIRRFADVLAARTGQGSRLPLDDASLAELQRQILGRRTSLGRFGLRQSPVFVGEVVRYQEIVHYIAPLPQDLEPMLAGLETFLDRTRGQSPVMRCAVAAFGFVYIHPLADGNGRVHRFLVNDLLRRDGAVPEPMILPVSALIAGSAVGRRDYARLLDRVSQPLMRTLAGSYRFAPTPTLHPDGVVSNFVFEGVQAARHVWRHPDLSPHVAYLGALLDRAVRQDMRQESRHLRSHGRARAAIKDLVEMPDAQIDRMIRSIQVNQGRLSGALLKELPVLAEPGMWDEVVRCVERAFDVDRPSDIAQPQGPQAR